MLKYGKKNEIMTPKFGLSSNLPYMHSQSIKIFKMFAPPAGVITININLPIS